MSGRPYSWTVAGNPRSFGSMLTPEGLAEVKSYADGIGPWKPLLMSLTIKPNNLFVNNGKLSDVNSIAPKNLINEAHKAGLFVHAFTFRNEPKYLAGIYKNDPITEYLAFYRAGVDGVFTDFAPTAFAARGFYLKEIGH